MRVYLGIAVLAVLMVWHAINYNAYKTIILVPDGFYGKFTIGINTSEELWNFRASPNYNPEHNALMYRLDSKQHVEIIPGKIKIDGSDTIISYTSFGAIPEFIKHSFDNPPPRAVYQCDYRSLPYSCMVGDPKTVCDFFFEKGAPACKHLEPL